MKVPLAIGCFLYFHRRNTNFKDQAVSGHPDAINSHHLEITAERNPSQDIKEMSQICVCVSFSTIKQKARKQAR